MDKKREKLNQEERNTLVDIMICPSRDNHFSPEEDSKSDNTKK